MKLAIVSPCYNEEAVLESSARRLTGHLEQLIEKGLVASDSYILYVNDGSNDRTWEIIKYLHNNNRSICGLSLAWNTGHQNALMAGMMKVRGNADAVITIDSDLQDDLNAIDEMILKFREGYDVVFGVKTVRDADSWLKKSTARLFYGFQRSMGIKTIPDHADFRLISAKVLDCLAQYPERNLYLRGIITSLGFKSTTVEDIISPREAGSSKYTLRKMTRLALDGITSFSIRPMTIVMMTGLVFLLIAVILGIRTIWVWCKGMTVPGWTSLMVSIWFIGSILLLSIGILGIYIGKIYSETKHRPLYFEEEYLGLD
jgi:glycosyltransferase involved in cell wall biosynthesis